MNQKTLGDTLVTRFAPSPTGLLHLGHAYSALFAWRLADSAGGKFHLRIEDIDIGRCRPEFEEAIIEDLRWVGIDWVEPVWRQSQRMHRYGLALAKLDAMGLVYPCFCTRKDIAAEVSRSGTAPHLAGPGPDGPVYPGICRALDTETRRARIADGEPHALRLDMAAATACAGTLTWHDRTQGEQTATPETFGDVVLARKDVATSYHLAVTVDDAAQGVSLITRGVDLFAATDIHRLLQALLDLDVPEWHHIPLLTNGDGVRLTKRNQASTLRALRESGTEPSEIWAKAIRQIAQSAVLCDGK
ncbi:MAG: tRNA glutamyl-Q(34) synthetase GluQRS [Alphaproteobacteria bacterium]|nr:tRNA glutamyl-Q(34) synthetase GluQRS [Alphaproteobacteria bacterium]HCP00295.1 tRNA glutamyl-Q(34) synthetase GluQRS [Rhodospirillaceae bacterium]